MFSNPFGCTDMIYTLYNYLCEEHEIRAVVSIKLLLMYWIQFDLVLEKTGHIIQLKTVILKFI